MRKTADQNTVTVTIETPGGLNSQTGKSEEVAILALITDRVRGTQTYLDSLFTGDLLDYFKGKVTDDFCPDIMAEYNAEVETNRTLTRDLQAANLRAENIDRDRAFLADGNKQNVANKDAMIDRLTFTVSEVRECLNTERYEHKLAMTERDSLAEQVTKLKVMLFDLQNRKDG
jgi:hypothetical protein